LAQFILENPYGGIDEWNDKLDVGNKATDAS
jgi:hypothetical protein